MNSIIGSYRSYSVVFDKTTIDFVVTENIPGVLSAISSMERIEIQIDEFSPVEAEIQEFHGYNNRKLILKIVIDDNDVVTTGINALVNYSRVTIHLKPISTVDRIVMSDFYNKILLGLTNLMKVYNLGNLGEIVSLLKDKYGLPSSLSSTMSQAEAEQYYASLVTESDEIGVALFTSDSAFKYAKFFKQRLRDGKCAICEKDKGEVIDDIPLCIAHAEERRRIGKVKFDKKYKFV